MSLDHTPGASDGEHLDEEATSAALDGDASPHERAHLERCAACRASVERLRVAQEAVAAPVPVDAEARSSAVAAALAAYDDEQAARPAPGGDSPVRAIAGRRSGGRRRAPVPWLGIAAVLLLVVLAVPLLRGAGGGPASDRSGSEAAGGDAAEDGSGEESTSAAAPPVDVGDLGPIDAGEDLRPVVDAALGAEAGQEATSDEGGATANETTEQGEEGSPASGSEDGVESDGDAGPGAGSESAPEPPATPDAVAGSARPTAQSGAEEDALEEARAACEETVRAALPGAGALVLVGSGTVDGAPALVLGFAGPSERPAVLTAVVRRADCELVTFQSYVRG